MMAANQIIEWLKTLDSNAGVGVDEGGLCLRVEAEDSEEYLEIGGLPECCRTCGADLAKDAGEGYDGECGACADKTERQRGRRRQA